MKIYINNYNTTKLNSKMPILDKFLSNSYNKLNFVSEEGIFTIKNENIYQIYTENEENVKIVNNYLNEHEIIIDYSNHMFIKKYSLPYEYVEINNIVFTFMLNKNDDIKLVFTGKYKENQFTNFFKKIHNKYDALEISDFYFDVNEKNIHNDCLKNKINEFLSLLN